MGISNLAFSATNVQTGLLADIPANCALGDEYNATDVNEKYVCFVANTWTKLVGRNAVNGVAGLDANGHILSSSIPDVIKNNIALNAFRIAVNGALTRFNLQDGVIDDFNDSSGILSGGHVAGGILTHETEYYSDATQHSGTGTAWVLVSTYTALESGTEKIQFLYRSDEDPRICSVEVRVNDVPVIDVNTDSTSFIEYNGTITYVEDDVITFYVHSSYSANSAYIDNIRIYTDIGDIISVSTIAENVPAIAHLNFISSPLTPNTDLLAYVSADDGATWQQVTFEDDGDFQSGRIMMSGSCPLTREETMKYKLSCIITGISIYAVGLLWD